jgi:hypothetical protein
VNSEEARSEIRKATGVGETLSGCRVVDVLIEDVNGNIHEIESVRFSVIGGGRVVIKALAYDDEFDPEDVPDPDVES